MAASALTPRLPDFAMMAMRAEKCDHATHGQNDENKRDDIHSDGTIDSENTTAVNIQQ